MRSNEAFPSKYLKGDELRGKPDMRLTIHFMNQEPVGDNQELKWILHFREMERGLVLNKTNWYDIEEAYGDSDDWPDKPIKLYFDPNVMFGGKKRGGLRVRLPTPAQVAALSAPKTVGNKISTTPQPSLRRMSATDPQNGHNQHVIDRRSNYELSSMKPVPRDGLEEVLGEDSTDIGSTF